MLEYRFARDDDIDLLVDTRFEMIRIVNDLSDDYVFSKSLIELTRKYFLNGDQTTVIATVDGEFAGCASICYITVMPTFAHPTGRRAHVTNVYTRESFRRRGIASKLMAMLIEDAWSKSVTEINLFATDEGRPLYESLGFKSSSETMIIERELNI